MFIGFSSIYMGFSSIFTGIHAVIQALAYAFTLTQPGPAAGPANVTDRRLGQALPFWVKKHGWFLPSLYLYMYTC